MPNVKITSDEATYTTKVVDADTGAEIKGIASMDVTFRVDDVVRARIELCSVNVKTSASAEIVVADPRTGDMKAIKRIEFADGSTFDAAGVVETTALGSESRTWEKPRAG